MLKLKQYLKPYIALLLGSGNFAVRAGDAGADAALKP